MSCDSAIVATETKSKQREHSKAVGTRTTLHAMDGVLLVADQAIASLTSFASAVLVARSVSVSDYGNYVVAICVMQILLGMQSSITSIPLALNVPRQSRCRARAYFGSVLSHSFLLGFSLVAVGGFASATMDGLGMALFTTSLVLTTFAATSASLRDVVRQYYLSTFRPSIAVGLGVFTNGCSLIAYCSFYYFDALTVDRALLTLTVAIGFPTLVVLLATRRQWRLSYHHIIVDAHRNWTAARWLLARSIADIASTRSYPLALAFWWGRESAAFFGAIMAIAALLNPFLIGTSNFIRPKLALLAAGTSTDFKRIVSNTTLLILLVCGVFCIAVLLAGDSLIDLLFGSKYSGHRVLLVGCALSALASGTSIPFSIGIDALGRTDATFGGKIIATVSSLLIGIPLTAYYGLSGAVLGAIVTSVVTAAIFAWYFIRLTRHLS